MYDVETGEESTVPISTSEQLRNLQAYDSLLNNRTAARAFIRSVGAHELDPEQISSQELLEDYKSNEDHLDSLRRKLDQQGGT